MPLVRIDLIQGQPLLNAVSPSWPATTTQPRQNPDVRLRVRAGNSKCRRGDLKLRSAGLSMTRSRASDQTGAGFRSAKPRW
jgi:hypothetical protein